jgi:hypothetical protein
MAADLHNRVGGHLLSPRGARPRIALSQESTFGEVAEGYFATLVDVGPRTLAAYRRNCEMHVAAGRGCGRPAWSSVDQRMRRRLAGGRNYGGNRGVVGSGSPASSPLARTARPGVAAAARMPSTGPPRRTPRSPGGFSVRSPPPDSRVQFCVARKLSDHAISAYGIDHGETGERPWAA